MADTTHAAPASSEMWDQLYAVANGHVPTPEEIAGRLTVLRAVDRATADSVTSRFLVEVLRAIVTRGNRDAEFAAAALIVIGAAR